MGTEQLDDGYEPEQHLALERMRQVRMKRVAARISAILEKCDSNAPPPADMTAWENMTPVGKEMAS